jgi:hypothetical protein
VRLTCFISRWVVSDVGIASSPAWGRSDRSWRVTAAPAAASHVRCHAGRCASLARDDAPTAENNDGDSSPTGWASGEQRLAAVVWDRNLVPIPAPRPHRFIRCTNRGALLESTSLRRWRRDRHTFCVCIADHDGDIAASRRPPVDLRVDPAHTLPHRSSQTVRHACVPGRFCAARLGASCSPIGWSDHDVMQKGRPLPGRRPNSQSLIGPAHRPDECQSSGRPARGRRFGVPGDRRFTYGARR